MATGPQNNLSVPRVFSSSDLVFSDDFSGITLDKDWHTYIMSNAAKGPPPWNSNGSGGSNQGGPYVAAYDLARNSTTA